MATVGPNNAGTVQNIGRAVLSWTNPTNAQGVQNGTNATLVGDGLNTSTALAGSNMGWGAIPAGSVVSNLKFEAFIGASAAGFTCDYTVADTIFHTAIASGSFFVPTVAAWVVVYNADPPASFDSLFIAGTDEYNLGQLSFVGAVTFNVDAYRVTVTYTTPSNRRLLLMGVG